MSEGIPGRAEDKSVASDVVVLQAFVANPRRPVRRSTFRAHSTKLRFPRHCAGTPFCFRAWFGFWYLGWFRKHHTVERSRPAVWFFSPLIEIILWARTICLSPQLGHAAVSRSTSAILARSVSVTTLTVTPHLQRQEAILVTMA